MSEARPIRVTLPDDVRLPKGTGKISLAILTVGLLVGGAGCLMGTLGGDGLRQQLSYSYLTAFMFVTSLSLGGLFWAMIHHLTGAGWSVVIRRFAENNSMALFVLFPMFVPMVFLGSTCWKWMETPLSSDALLVEKQPYLSDGFFWARAVGYFAIWAGLATLINFTSRKQDYDGDVKHSRAVRKWGGPSMFALAITSSFAAIDWMMTLDYHWFSTIFGVYYWAGSIWASMAFMVLIATGLRAFGHLRNTVTIEHLHDMGKLLFGFTMFWTYIGFSQYFLIWYANIPEETLWYIHRRELGHSVHPLSWNQMSWVLFFGHFIIPFFFLLRRDVKRNPLLLSIAAVWILAFHFFDLYWQIMPNNPNYAESRGVGFHWLDFSSLLMLVSGFGLVVASQMIRSPLIPMRDPRLHESLAFHNL